ncbi:hypothetical protein MVEN_00979900 [Mycena venus]|uniref:F-box domain-containing protein n=1 Tax=Mycena venus TaxID=2733690 RepID=A0A8H6YB24_9AGAR|nr:hypothetical protein MVEN_00979900 [Mycena venus]
MLARSKMASLVVRVDLREDYENSPEPILLEHTSRLGTLDIFSPQLQLAAFMANLEHADAAPRLQHMKIVNIDEDNLGEGGMWLPTNLFRRREVIESRKTLQDLRLHLESCAFPWDSAWYSNLTHLHLGDISRTQRPTTETFLAILVDSPNLETLTLVYSCPTMGRPFPVQLRNLTLLTIDDSTSLCYHLLRCLVVPPSAIINISSIIVPEYDLKLTKIIYQDLIPVLSQDLPPNMYDSVRIDYINGFAYSFFHSARQEWSRKLQIDAAWGKDWWPALGSTAAVRDHLDFSTVTTLHLRCMPDVPLPPFESEDEVDYFYATLSLWDTMGRNLTRVRTLHLHNSLPGPWLEFLLTQAMFLIGVSHFKSPFYVPTSDSGLPFRGPDGTLTHAWPGLRCLALHNIDLDLCGDVLRALLWARREGGAPIQQLDIEECPGISTHDLEHFGPYADVLYDGVVQERERPKTHEEAESLRSDSIGIFVRLVESRNDSQSFHTQPYGQTLKLASGSL